MRDEIDSIAAGRSGGPMGHPDHNIDISEFAARPLRTDSIAAERSGGPIGHPALQPDGPIWLNPVEL